MFFLGSGFAEEIFVECFMDQVVDTVGNKYINVQPTGSVVGNQPLVGLVHQLGLVIYVYWVVLVLQTDVYMPCSSSSSVVRLSASCARAMDC